MQLAPNLEFEPHGAIRISKLIVMEKKIGCQIPNEYRDFLLATGGGYVRDGIAACTVPTPFGEMNITEFSGIRGIMDMLDSQIVPPDMICIGLGHFGMLTGLAIAGSNRGSVYALDTEMRHLWTNEDLLKRPHLRQSIKDFFSLRDNNQLPVRPIGYEHCYLIAQDFAAFVATLRSAYDD